MSARDRLGFFSGATSASTQTGLLKAASSVVQISAEPLCRTTACYGASAFVSESGYLQGLEVG